jgi:hypothetical protein
MKKALLRADRLLWVLVFWFTKEPLFRESGMSYPSTPWLNLNPPAGRRFLSWNQMPAVALEVSSSQPFWIERRNCAEYGRGHHESHRHLASRKDFRIHSRAFVQPQRASK